MNHHYETLYAGEFDGKPMYAVYLVGNGRTRQVSSMYADVLRANLQCQAMGVLDNVHWYGR